MGGRSRAFGRVSQSASGLQHLEPVPPTACAWERMTKKVVIDGDEDCLTCPSLRTQKHSAGPRRSSETVAVRWNFAFSLASWLAFFCALRASQTPIVVGIAEMIINPRGMPKVLPVCRSDGKDGCAVREGSYQRLEGVTKGIICFVDWRFPSQNRAERA
jgi:hypothetical protein